MSETKEVVEKPLEVPEPAGEDDGKCSEDTVEISKKDSDISMLEDEEMPTFNSISSSTKPNNSVATFEQKMEDVPPERDRSPSPEPSEEHDNEDNESIYVVSSTADTDRNPEDIDDEEEEDYDSEDMNEDDDEDEDEDDEGHDYDADRYDRDSDEFEADRFERASDDFVLRHNDSIKKDFKERSQSLQDLATVEARYGRRRNSRFQWERNLSGLKENPYSQSWNSKQFQGPERYKHIESKVKRYIQDIKTQNRLSKNEEVTKSKNRSYEVVEDSETTHKSSAGGKHIKEYADKVIKGLERDEFDEHQNSTYATLERMENGEEPMTLRLSSDRMSGDSNIPMEVDHSPMNKQNHDDRLRKVNGIIEFSAESEVTCTPIIKGTTLNRMNEQVNGTEPARNLVNLRTLSYEEYMRGGPREEEEEEEEEEEDVEIDSNEICLISPEKTSYDSFPSKLHNSNSVNSMQITSVKNTRHILDDDNHKQHAQNSVTMINQATETIQVENPEVLMLKTSLSEKNTQFECLQVAYQKTLAENIAMKKELENLKKTLKEQSENQNREKKSTAMQTEKLVVTDQQKNTITVENFGNKVSTNSITSAISSIHQWSESNSSPTISMQSPDVRNALNSDDSSVFENTPKKPTRTFSRAFITSSRILQTLSNITQGKCNVSSPFTQDQKNKETLGNQVNTTEDPSTSGTPLNSKKRKATEMLGMPPFEQPFKIPHTSGSGRKKTSQESDNGSSQMNGLPPGNENCMGDSKDGGDQEKKMKGELGDNLKYYVYQDEENSKGRSFLIQTEETGKISNKGTVRECGPYLLGNLEVRMTEVNGTINIWGKEINLDSTEEDLGISAKSAEIKPDLCWQKTPRMNLLNNSYIVSSSNKKANLQSRFNDTYISKFSHSSENNIPNSYLQKNERSCNRRSSLTTDDNCNCSSRSHHLSWSGCKHLMEEQKHACCSRNDINYDRCGYTHNVRSHDYHPCDRVHSCAGDIRRHSYSGGFNDISTSACSNHLNHCFKTGNEGNCRHQPTHCKSSCDEDKNYQHFPKRCHSPKEFAHSYNYKHTGMNDCRENSSSNYYQSRSSTNHDEDEPLISPRQNEPPEVRKKRISGKKVRGLLMDLLKGCGDCRTPNPTNISKSNLGGRESTYMPACPPEITVTPCSPRASSSNQSQSMEKNRCCDTCSRRIEMATEIEAQLEFFRIEMERLRSRSDALLDKFNLLKSPDVN